MTSSANDLLDLLGSDLNRRILALTSDEARGADAIDERCSASLPTIYRHIDDLQSAGLLDERTQYDLGGNHYKTYRAAISSLTVDVDDGDLSVSVDRVVQQHDGPEEPTPEGVERPGTEPSTADVERPESDS